MQKTRKLAGDQSESRLFERKGEGPLGIFGILGAPRAGWSMLLFIQVSRDPQILTRRFPAGIETECDNVYSRTDFVSGCIGVC